MGCGAAKPVNESNLPSATENPPKKVEEEEEKKEE